jgi:hypothetical protein
MDAPAAAVFVLLQYLCFCTSKASKVSTDCIRDGRRSECRASCCHERDDSDEHLPAPSPSVFALLYQQSTDFCTYQRLLRQHLYFCTSKASTFVPVKQVLLYQRHERQLQGQQTCARRIRGALSA